MELIDILTPAGAPTGIVKPKQDVHRDGDWHRAAHLWIVTADDRVLLQRRADVKENWPGLWDISVAGHVNAGESALSAIVRESFEELGLRFAPDELTHVGTLPYHAVLNGGTYIENEIHEVFFVRRDIDVTALVLDPLEVAAVALVPPDALDDYEMVVQPGAYELLRAALADATGATGF
jgi:isopentenyldiphosphate isomerase